LLNSRTAASPRIFPADDAAPVDSPPGSLDGTTRLTSLVLASTCTRCPIPSSGTQSGLRFMVLRMDACRSALAESLRDTRSLGESVVVQ
jgi:hypothetical protein